MSFSRWLHIYLSMASFAVVLFFAATGFTLNHPEWFTAQQMTTQSRGALDPVWLKGVADQNDKLWIVERLRAQHRIQGAVSEFHIDSDQCSFSFRGPGYQASVVIDRSTSKYEITETQAGWVALLNDLHKGRDTGNAWKSMIDVSSVLLATVSITGLTLLLLLHKRRVSGLLVLVAGALSALAIYKVAVP